MRRCAPRLLALAVAALLVLAGCGRGGALPPDEVGFWFFDVGQADCTLIRTEDATVLIDTGNIPEDGGSSLVRMLRDAGVDKIDLLVLTHPHADHIGGVATVFESFIVRACLFPALYADTDLFADTLRRIDESGCRVHKAERGAMLTVGSLAFGVLAPPQGVAGDQNAASVVLRVSFGDTVALFMGDATKETEAGLITLFGNALSADILKVSHHGSGDSSTPALLSAVSPSCAVISCGHKNVYGFPDPDVLRRLEAVDATVYRTDTDGTVILTADRTGNVTKK